MGNESISRNFGAVAYAGSGDGADIRNIPSANSSDSVAASRINTTKAASQEAHKVGPEALNFAKMIKQFFTPNGSFTRRKDQDGNVYFEITGTGRRSGTVPKNQVATLDAVLEMAGFSGEGATFKMVSGKVVNIMNSEGKKATDSQCAFLGFVLDRVKSMADGVEAPEIKDYPVATGAEIKGDEQDAETKAAATKDAEKSQETAAAQPQQQGGGGCLDQVVGFIGRAFVDFVVSIPIIKPFAKPLQEVAKKLIPGYDDQISAAPSAVPSGAATTTTRA